MTHLRCIDCGHDSSEAETEYLCPRCGGITDVHYDYARAAQSLTRATLAADRDPTIWRYRALLPIPQGARRTPLRVGSSPTYEVPRLAQLLGVGRLWIKDDGLLPTGSFKDRASYVGTARATAQRAQIVAAASTGNAATSLAGQCASLGMTCHIFVPSSAPEAKVAQLMVYGARVFLIDADYDATYDLCQEAVAKFGWYNRSAAVNPHLVEGKKTCGLEIAEQLGVNLGVMPDWVSMSVGDGCSIAGTAKGLREMVEIGLVERAPRMLAVQAEGAAPLTTAFASGTEDVQRIVADTLADSINVGMPRNPTKALRAVRGSEGTFVNVSDEAILQAIADIGKTTGVFAEPAASTSIAGVRAAVANGTLSDSDSVLCVISGNGLKDVKNAMKAVSRPKPLSATLTAVAAAVEGN